MGYEIAICVPRLDDQIQRDIVDFLIKSSKENEKFADSHFYVLATYLDIADPTPNTDGEFSIFSIIDRIAIDVLLVFPERFYISEALGKIIAVANERNIPVISVGKLLPGIVSIEYGMGQCMANIVSHIIEKHGCHHINFIAGLESMQDTDERLHAYKNTLTAHGIEVEEERIGFGQYWDYPTEQVLERFYNSSLPFPEAIICANDVMAITTVSSLREHGYRVPQDVIVTGFDGIDMERFHNPRLTTASVNHALLSDTIRDYIEKICKGEELPMSRSVEYIERFSQSCGCNEENSPDAQQFATLWKEVSCDIGFIDSVIRMSSMLKLGGELNKMLESIARFFNYIYTNELRMCVYADYVTGLSDDVKYEGKGASDVMYSILEKHGNENIQIYCDRAFPASDIIPDKKYGGSDFYQLTFYPLHYNDIVYGYVAADTALEHIQLYQLRALSMNLGFVLERIANFKYMEAINKHLEKTSIYDSMTGLYSRNGYYTVTRKIIEPHLDSDKRIVIISVDLDNLKDINDKFGHSCGDTAIKLIAETLLEYVGEDGIAARFGGDEFVGLKLFDGSTEKFVSDFSEGFACSIADKVEKQRLEYNVSASFGVISLLMKNLPSLEEGIKSADVLMYAQKRAKKRAGRTSIY